MTTFLNIMYINTATLSAQEGHCEHASTQRGRGGRPVPLKCEKQRKGSPLCNYGHNTHIF